MKYTIEIKIAKSPNSNGEIKYFVYDDIKIALQKFELFSAHKKLNMPFENPLGKWYIVSDISMYSESI